LRQELWWLSNGEGESDASGRAIELGGYGRVLQGDEALGIAAGFAELCEVGLHLRVGAEGSEGRVQDGGGSGVGEAVDAVVHPLAFAAGFDDAGASQVGEVAGDFGLRLAEDLDEVADADLVAGHEVEQAEAGGVGERGEEAGRVEGFCGASHILKYTP
jgi:hypothetical protein